MVLGLSQSNRYLAAAAFKILNIERDSKCHYSLSFCGKITYISSSFRNLEIEDPFLYKCNSEKWILYPKQITIHYLYNSITISV